MEAFSYMVVLRSLLLAIKAFYGCCSEEFIALAILRLVETEKSVVEGAGATGLAAILAGLLPELKNKK